MSRAFGSVAFSGMGPARRQASVPRGPQGFAALFPGSNSIRSGRGFLLLPAPVPRFVDDSMGVGAWITDAESEALRVTRKPRKCGGMFESFAERRSDAISDVQCAAGVMLAVSGRRVRAENVVEMIAAGQLASDQLRLTLHAPKTRDRPQRDPVCSSRRPSSRTTPCAAAGARKQSRFWLSAPIETSSGRLGLKRQAAQGSVIGRNAEFDPDFFDIRRHAAANLRVSVIRLVPPASARPRLRPRSPCPRP